ncbi:MAG: hypothetical protein PUC32_07475 [Oscillospiraceae bacterium]|nr:hypothetical protein [Oscillospiraceae bacterium]
MEDIVWFIIMVPCSAVFTIIGIYAWNRKKPMWFWAGSTVEESEIADVSAYNRANGLMWLVFSLPLWLSTFIELWNEIVALFLIAADCVIGLPVLMIVYKRIYTKYKA